MKKIGPFLERGISFRANSRTGYKKLAHFKKGVSIVREIFFERGGNLESRAAHTHPKNAQVPPRALSTISRKNRDLLNVALSLIVKGA